MSGQFIEKIASWGPIFLADYVMAMMICLLGLLFEKKFHQENAHLRSWILRITLVLVLLLPLTFFDWSHFRTSFALVTRHVASDESSFSTPLTAKSPKSKETIATWRPVVTSLRIMQDRAQTQAMLGLSFWQILSASFLTISFFYSCRLLIQTIISFLKGRWLRRQGKALSETEAACYLAIANRLKVGHLPVLKVNGLTSPLLLGLFDPVILIPEGLSDCGEIYYHELTHFNRQDLRWRLVAWLVTTTMPLQPGGWFVKKALEYADEDICDDMVLIQGVDRSGYANLLLDLAESQQTRLPEFCLPMATSSQLESRLYRIMDCSRKISGYTLRGGIFLLILLLIMGFLIGAISVNCAELLRTGLPSVLPKPTEISLAPYANNNIEQNLVLGFPIGRFIPPNNDFGIPFDIPATGPNYIEFNKQYDDSPVTISVMKPGVRRVYTMIQAYGPHEDKEICRVEFFGSGGAYQSFELYAGTQVRDFFESAYAKTINNTTTRNALQIVGQGGAFTGNTQTGPHGFYNFDEQEFMLAPIFSNQTLQTIQLSCPHNGGTAILLGITVDTAPIPDPTLLLVTASHLTVIACYLLGLVICLLVIVVIYVSTRKTMALPVKTSS